MDFQPGQLPPLPQMVRVRQKFPRPAEPDIRAAVRREFERPAVGERLRPGMKVAIGVGSRGLARLAEIVRAVVDEVKARGAEPFIVPAMGSHGGATPEGQMEVLASYGVTPEAIGVPFRPSLETKVLGTTEHGVNVFLSTEALAADAIIPVCRVKLHTDFRGPIESGFCKMLAIGFGKLRGAESIHAWGFSEFNWAIPEVAEYIAAHVPQVAFAVCSLENAFEDVARIEAVPVAQMLTREPELLAESASYMAKILSDKFDVLVVDELGKNISGGGMDPNITGRHTGPHMSGGPSIQKIVVLGLTEETHGNACGIGYADITTRRVVEGMDHHKTWTNIVTSTVLRGGAIPIWMPSDRDAIALAIKACNRIDFEKPRLVRIKNTLELQTMHVSASFWESDLKHRQDMEALSEAEPWPLDQQGNLLPPVGVHR